MGFLISGIKSILGIIVILAIISLVALYSISSVVSESSVSDIIEDDAASNYNISDEDIDSIYESIIFECQSKSEISLSGASFGNITLNCDEAQAGGREGFEDYIISIIGESADNLVEGAAQEYSIPQSVRKGILGSAGMILILSAAIILLSGLINGLVTFGVIGIVSGLPFIALPYVRDFIHEEIEAFLVRNGIERLIDFTMILSEITEKMQLIYLLIFIIGIVLFAAGLCIIVYSRFKAKKKAEKDEN